MPKFNKLVRDRVPEIISRDGKRAVTHIATPEEFEKGLREKLKEEATEYYTSGREEELADVLEVVHAICESRDIPFSSVEEARRKKTAERGSFSKRIVLEEVV